MLVQVRGDGRAGSRVERGAEAGVEGGRVRGIEGDGGGVNLGLLGVDDVLNLLVVLVACLQQ